MILEDNKYSQILTKMFQKASRKFLNRIFYILGLTNENG